MRPPPRHTCVPVSPSRPLGLCALRDRGTAGAVTANQGMWVELGQGSGAGTDTQPCLRMTPCSDLHMSAVCACPGCALQKGTLLRGQTLSRACALRLGPSPLSHSCLSHTRASGVLVWVLVHCSLGAVEGSVCVGSSLLLEPVAPSSQMPQSGTGEPLVPSGAALATGQDWAGCWWRSAGSPRVLICLNHLLWGPKVTCSVPGRCCARNSSMRHREWRAGQEAGSSRTPCQDCLQWPSLAQHPFLCGLAPQQLQAGGSGQMVPRPPETLGTLT